jgi:hypothetical protein
MGARGSNCDGGVVISLTPFLRPVDDVIPVTRPINIESSSLNTCVSVCAFNSSFQHFEIMHSS